MCMHNCLSLGLYFFVVFTIGRELPQALSPVIFKICNYKRKADILEDESTMQKGLEWESPQGLMISVCFLSPIPHRPSQCHTCLIFFFHKLRSFSSCVRGRHWTRDSSVFMPPLTIYDSLNRFKWAKTMWKIGTGYHLAARLNERRIRTNISKAFKDRLPFCWPDSQKLPFIISNTKGILPSLLFNLESPFWISFQCCYHINVFSYLTHVIISKLHLSVFNSPLSIL